jgi:integrase
MTRRIRGASPYAKQLPKRVTLDRRQLELLLGVPATTAAGRRERAPLFRDFALEWFERYCRAKRRKPGTMAHRRNYLRLYLMPPLRRWRMDEMDASAIEAVKDHMTALTDQTRNEALVILGMILGAAKDAGWLSALPRIELETIVRARPRIHDPDEYALIVRAARRLSWRNHLAVLLCGDAGMRRAEVAGLEWPCVHLDTRTLDIVVQAPKAQQLISPKNGLPRSVAMTDDLFDALRRAERRAKTLRVVPGIYHPAISGSMVYWLVVDSVVAAGLDARGGAHILRHTMASHALDSGATITAVQEVLGHKNLATTAGYLHASTKTIQNAARLLSAMRSRHQK